MNRRRFLQASLGGVAGGLLAAPSARADFTDLGNGLKRVLVQQPRVVKQECPLWCWAASISMVFDIWGHQVDQIDIVNQTFGGVVCSTAPSAVVIAQNLSRPWRDRNGTVFNSHLTAAYDAQAVINNLNNNFLVSELGNNRPVVYCNQHHAMVLAVMDYLDTPNGPIPQAMGVLDPYPGSPDFHWLSFSEIVAANLGGQMMFLGAVQIT